MHKSAVCHHGVDESIHVTQHHEGDNLVVRAVQNECLRCAAERGDVILWQNGWPTPPTSEKE